ncbi:MAG TPA: hypothetical protein PL120_04360 [Bacilli bacterium]|nr:hypothetical protein [Bacilli bacterium]
MKKKIDQSRKAKQNFDSPILPFLQGNERIDKKTLSYHLSQPMMPKPLDGRTVREKISEVSLYYPVLSSSKKKGYRLARPFKGFSLKEAKDERSEVRETANEIMSRINYLKRKLKPLIAYDKAISKYIAELEQHEASCGN